MINTTKKALFQPLKLHSALFIRNAIGRLENFHAFAGSALLLRSSFFSFLKAKKRTIQFMIEIMIQEMG